MTTKPKPCACGVPHDMIAEIARRILNVPTLAERKSDALDFHDCSVWAIRDALEAAYEAGKKASKR